MVTDISPAVPRSGTQCVLSEENSIISHHSRYVFNKVSGILNSEYKRFGHNIEEGDKQVANLLA